jgi:hypothetical protein
MMKGCDKYVRARASKAKATVSKRNIYQAR